MCIRDRLNAVGRDVEMDVGQSGQRPGVEAGQADDQRGALVGPVSYTHLRAHETVLDLVCRLLLEKKNTKTQSTNPDIYRLYYTQSKLSTNRRHLCNSSIHHRR